MYASACLLNAIHERYKRQEKYVQQKMYEVDSMLRLINRLLKESNTYYTVAAEYNEDYITTGKPIINVNVFDEFGEYVQSYTCKTHNEAIDWLDEFYPDSLPATVAPKSLFLKMI